MMTAARFELLLVIYMVYKVMATTSPATLTACDPNPCQRGTCIVETNYVWCNCSGTGYDGTICGSDVNECLDPAFCLHNGTCTNSVGGYTCTCLPNSRGDRCEVLIVPAASQDSKLFLPVWAIVLSMLGTFILVAACCLAGGMQGGGNRGSSPAISVHMSMGDDDWDRRSRR